MLVGAGGPVALQTSSMGEDSAEAGNSDFCGARPGAGEICRLPRRVFRSWELEGRSPSRPLAPVRSLNRVDTDPHAALRALLVGLRPPTPQSPEGLRSTPFDCVAIAPCCFAFRKAVLSHALAALTALVPVRTQCRYGNSARGAACAVPINRQKSTGNTRLVCNQRHSKRPAREGFGGEKAARSVASLPVPLELRHTPGCDIPARIRTGSAPAKGSGNAMGSFRKKAGRPLVFPRLSFPPARACR